MSVKETTASVEEKKKPTKALTEASKLKPRSMPIPKHSATAGPENVRATTKKRAATAKAKANPKKKVRINGAP